MKDNNLSDIKNSNKSKEKQENNLSILSENKSVKNKQDKTTIKNKNILSVINSEQEKQDNKVQQAKSLSESKSDEKANWWEILLALILTMTIFWFLASQFSDIKDRIFFADKSYLPTKTVVVKETSRAIYGENKDFLPFYIFAPDPEPNMHKMQSYLDDINSTDAHDWLIPDSKNSRKQRKQYQKHQHKIMLPLTEI